MGGYKHYRYTIDPSLLAEVEDYLTMEDIPEEYRAKAIMLMAAVEQKDGADAAIPGIGKITMYTDVGPYIRLYGVELDDLED